MRGTHWILLAVSLACASGTPPVGSTSEAAEPVGGSVNEPPASEVEAPVAAEPARAEVAAALGVAEDDLFAFARGASETWAIVRVTPRFDASPSSVDAVDDRCPDHDFECAVAVSGSREEACGVLGCRSWQLRAVGNQSTPPIPLTPPVPSLETRRAPTLEVRDVDGVDGLEVIATYGVQLGDVDGLWTIRLTRIVDVRTGQTQGVFLRRSENDTFADEGRSSQYHVTDQSWRFEGAMLHLHEVIGEGMCDSGNDGPPVARGDDFDGCEVTIRDRVCTHRQATDDYECRGAGLAGALALPRWLASKLDGR